MVAVNHDDHAVALRTIVSTFHVCSGEDFGLLVDRRTDVSEWTSEGVDGRPPAPLRVIELLTASRSILTIVNSLARTFAK